jgi:Putative addiction module component
MNRRIETIVEEARKLTAEEREVLLVRLQHEFIDEGADGTPEEIEAAWAQDLDRRLDRAERGETTFIRHEDSMAGLRLELARMRSGK